MIGTIVMSIVFFFLATNIVQMFQKAAGRVLEHGTDRGPLPQASAFWLNLLIVYNVTN